MRSVARELRAQASVDGRREGALPGVRGVAAPKLSSCLMRLLRLEVTVLDEECASGFEWLKPVGVMEKLVLSTQKDLCSKLIVGEGLAMKAALMENLYVLSSASATACPSSSRGSRGRAGR